MKNFIRCAGVMIFSTVMVLQSYSLTFQKESGAKALFYDPESGAVLKPHEKKKDSSTGIVKVKRVQPSQVKYTGLHYWIELDGFGPVSADRIFRTGDRIRVHIRSNVDGYLSLWSLNSSGVGKLLFPVSGQLGSDNYIKADSEYLTPGKIRFSLPAEDERLLVFFSRSKTDMPEYAANAPNDNVVARVQGAAGSKSLVFETENNNSAEVGNYVVNKNGGPVVREIRLRHQ